MLGLVSTRYFASKVTRATPRPLQTPIGLKINPYLMFVKTNFKKDPTTKTTDALKDLSKQWKNLSVDAKKQYTDLTKEFNEKKLDDFKKLSSEEQEKLVNLSIEKRAARAQKRLNKERREKRLQEGRPVAPPNAYALFIKEKATGTSSDVTKVVKDASVLWKKMTEHQKEKYTREAKKLSDEFHVKLEKWEAEKKAKKAEEDH